jgi:hypothetical protein
VRFEGVLGLAAVLQALDNVRRLLLASAVEPQQAAGYLGCINLHLAQLLGVRGEFRTHLQECAGLLCPNCKGYVGFVSDLSGACHLCGEKLFPFVTNDPGAAQQGHAPRIE